MTTDLCRAACSSFVMMLLWSSLSASRADEPKSGEQKSVPELVQMLGSGRHAEREAATRALKARGDALPSLRKVAEAGDVETRRRAKEIITALMNRRLATFADYGRKGRIDLLTEWLGTWDGPLDDAAWQAVLEIASELANRSGLPQLERKNLDTRPFWDYSFRDYCEMCKSSGLPPTFPINPEKLEKHPKKVEAICVSRGRRYLVGEDAISSIIVNAAPVKLRALSGCILFSNGDVTLGSAGVSVIVTDGTFRSRGGGNAVILARKDIEFSDGALYAMLAAGGRASVALRTIKAPQHNIIKEGAKRPLDFVRFFETSDLGIGVAPVKDGLKVENAAAGFPPAKAGLKTGDLIVEVDGKKSADPETFRRQLRRAFVLGEASVTVRRGDKTIVLSVPFYGFDLLKGK